MSTRIRSILLDMDAHRPWVIKDPRLCLTFPFWRPYLEVPVVVTMTRDPVEVALSLHSRNQLPLHHGLAIWEYYAAGMINAARNLPTIHITHREVLERPYPTVKALFERLRKAGVEGLRLPTQEEVDAFIEPKLYRSRTGTLHAAELLTAHQQHLCALAEGREKPPEAGYVYPSQLSRHIMQHYDAQEHLRVQQEQSLRGVRHQLEEAHREIGRVGAELAEAQRRAQHGEERANALETRLEQQEQSYGILLNNREEDIRRLYASLSWRLGNRLVRLARTLTFSGGGEKHNRL
jgi:hypothetical protein